MHGVPPNFIPSILWFLVPASLMEATLLVLRSLVDLRFRVPETVGLLLLLAIFYLVSVYFVLRVEKKGPARARVVWLIMAVALIFRITVWPMFPALSDDVFRYRWEGKLQAAGGNPYQSAPADPEWEHLKDAAYDRVVAKDVKAGYGPLTELIERVTYHAVSCVTDDPYRQVFWFKAPAALCELGALIALWALLASQGWPVSRILIYAWSPLPLIESWATGHNDTTTILFILLALLAASHSRWMLAFSSLTLAAAAKVWPLMLFPVFVGWRGLRPLRWYQWLVSLPVAGLLVWPFWSDVEQQARFMTGFVGGWRNNDSVYGLLLWITGDQYAAKYAAFAIVGATVLAVTLLRLPLERASLIAIATLLMVSANCHPWYLTWLLPFLVFTPNLGLLLWTLLMPLAYRVLIEWSLLGEWNGSTPWRWLIYVPVYGLLAGYGARQFTVWFRRRQARPFGTTH